MKSWQTFFLLLFLCGLAAALIPWIYHQSQELTPECLTQNSDLWKAKQPNSYTLRVFVDENTNKSTWVFRIEDKQIVATSENGHFKDNSAGVTFLPGSLLETLKAWLDYKNQDKKTPFISVSFHPQLGYPIRAVLRRKTPPYRLEIQIVLENHTS